MVVTRVSFPNSIWDGSSRERDSKNAPNRAPNWKDWIRIIKELSATQLRVLRNSADIDAIRGNSGTSPVVDGLIYIEEGDVALHKTIIKFDGYQLVTTDGSTPATDGAWGTQLLYTFPLGQLRITDVHIFFKKNKLKAIIGDGIGLSNTANFGLSIGTVTATNNSKFGLSDKEENILTEVDVNFIDGKNDIIITKSTSIGSIHNGSNTQVIAYLNLRTFSNVDHGIAADLLSMQGEISIYWKILGRQ